MIYEPLVRTGYEWINTIHDSDYEVFASFDGRSRAQTWKPVQVKTGRADHRQAFRRSDFPWLGSHALVLRERAVTALRDVVSRHAEILPLAAADGSSMFVLNVLTIVDALDEERSKTRRLDDGTLLRVTRPYFHESTIRGLDMFRLPLRTSPTYLSQAFIEAAAKAELVGLEFNLAWTPGIGLN